MRHLVVAVWIWLCYAGAVAQRATDIDIAARVDTLAAEALSRPADSDEGTIENFESEGKLHFRNPALKLEGIMLRQSEHVYALNENIEVHFIVHRGRAAWAAVYTGGLFMDAKRRIR